LLICFAHAAEGFLHHFVSLIVRLKRVIDANDEGQDEINAQAEHNLFLQGPLLKGQFLKGPFIPGSLLFVSGRVTHLNWRGTAKLSSLKKTYILRFAQRFN